MIKVNEIFKSIQGESTHNGRVCTFIRLTGCNLRCTYCDTKYSFDEGSSLSLEDVINKVKSLDSNLVEITGGEPLFQKETPELCSNLIELGYEVLIETNGSQDISILPDKVSKIVDVKCPDSGSFESFNIKNISSLTNNDECKFVISSKRDFEWSLRFIDEHKLSSFCQIIFSPNTNSFSAEKLADLIVSKNAPVRLGLQIHKILWGDKKGV